MARTPASKRNLLHAPTKAAIKKGVGRKIVNKLMDNRTRVSDASTKNATVSSPFARGSLFPIFFTVFLDMVGIGIIIPVLAVLFLGPSSALFAPTVAMTTRTLLLGALIATYPLGQFFGAPLFGALSDRHGRKPVLIYTLIGTAIGYILFAIGILTQQLWLLFVSRAIDGLTGGNIAVAMSAIADVSTKESKAKNFAVVGMAFGLGIVIGPFIGGLLADPSNFSWFNAATPIWFAAFLALLNIALVYWLFTETLQKPRTTSVSLKAGFSNLRAALARPHLRLIFSVFFLMMIGFAFFTQFFSAYLVGRFSLSEGQIGNTFAYLGMWIIIVQGLITRSVSKRYEPASVLRVSLLGLAIAIPFLLIPNQWMGIFFVLPFTALFQGLTMPNMTALVSNAAHADEQGEILGIQQSVQAIAITLPPLLSGFLFSLHMSLPIALGGLFVAFAWILFVAKYRTVPISN